MSAAALVKAFSVEGIEIIVEGKDLRLKSNGKSIPKDLIESLRPFKPQVLALLVDRSRLKKGSLVRVGETFGRIWEVYPKLARCGVVPSGCSQPMFVDLNEVESIPYEIALGMAITQAIEEINAVYGSEIEKSFTKDQKIKRDLLGKMELKTIEEVSAWSAGWKLLLTTQGGSK